MLLALFAVAATFMLGIGTAGAAGGGELLPKCPEFSPPLTGVEPSRQDFDNFVTEDGSFWCNETKGSGTLEFGNGLTLGLPANVEVVGQEPEHNNSEIVTAGRYTTGTMFATKVDGSPAVASTPGSRGWGIWNRQQGAKASEIAFFIFQHESPGSPPGQGPEGLFALCKGSSLAPTIFPLNTELLAGTHIYAVSLEKEAAVFTVDGEVVYRCASAATPSGALGPLFSSVWINNVFYTSRFSKVVEPLKEAATFHDDWYKQGPPAFVEAPYMREAPVLSAPSVSPNRGSFTLEWTPAVEGPTRKPVTYTLQHENSHEGWETIASGLATPSYAFTAGSPEAEGTWTYRVSATEGGSTSEWSSASAPIKSDKTPPAAPTASPDRAPDFAGGGGWYKDTVTVSFTDNGDPLLADGSSGSGVDLSTLTSPQTFSTDGSHEASGTVADNVGNVSAPATLAVQVDASPPVVEASCPAPVLIGAKGVNATVTAADGQSGLATDPSGTYPIKTDTAGSKTVKATAIDNVGHETSASCFTLVGYTRVITGNVGKTIVNAGQALELTSTAKVSGELVVKPGGAIDVEGATISGNLNANGATVVRICGANIAGTTRVIKSTASVVIGEGSAECASNTLHGQAIVKENTSGVLIDQNAFLSTLKVIKNAGGATVINNTIAGELLIWQNTGTVVDSPNTVEGKAKVQ
jgi:hypothetical protein